MIRQEWKPYSFYRILDSISSPVVHLRDYSTSLELFLDGQGVMYTAGTGLLDSFIKANEEGKNFDYLCRFTDNAVTSANEYWVFGGLEWLLIQPHGTMMLRDLLNIL